MQRIVAPEILDSLPAENPEAIRSRADLRVINWFMGNERWILERLGSQKNAKRVVELGAGEGKLTTRIKSQFNDLDVVAVDLIDRPPKIDNAVKWLQGNVLTADLPIDEKTVVVVNLFLHHLDADVLKLLGSKLSKAKTLIFAEPVRMRYALMLGYLIYPFVNRVTKHDMIVSIKAGFVPSELPAYFSEDFEWCEQAHPMGGLRSYAVK